jgi:putative FmdB family regulatory protein
MPVYEYYCQACDHEWEREQRISEDPVKSCPKCKARKAKRLISRTSFVLKGSGWYSDLYSSGGAKKGGDEAAGSEASGEPSGEASGGDAGAAKDKKDKGDKKDGKKSAKKDGGSKKSDSGSKAAA